MKNYYNCIYAYVNKINNKHYIGQAKDFNRRHRQHINESRRNNKKEYNLPFNCAIRKYGVENFETIILKENLKTQCLLNLYEYYYIDKYNSLSKNGCGYNIASGGSNGNPLAGKTEIEMKEIKRKISETHKGENNPFYGKCHTEETKQKLSEVNKGKKHSEETKQKISQANKGENHPMYGKHHSEESRQKMSEALRGENHPNYSKHHTDETKQKMSEAAKGKYCGKDNPMYGQHHSDEARQKISEARKGKNVGSKIAQYDEKGNLIKIWNYAKQIEKEMKIKATSVTACCRWYDCGEDLEEWHKIRKGNPVKSAKGFIWKYYKNEE